MRTGEEELGLVHQCVEEERGAPWGMGGMPRANQADRLAGARQSRAGTHPFRQGAVQTDEERSAMLAD